MRRLLLLLLATLGLGCGDQSGKGIEVTLPVSVLGAESRVLRAQLARFAKEHPEIRVIQRDTPDAADQRHQLYVQWLNAGASDPDILQLDAIWTPEFAAAGWILPLERFTPDTPAFFPATIEANRWAGHLYALPWFVDVGMLYWRTDLMDEPPATFDELRAGARLGPREPKVRLRPGVAGRPLRGTGYRLSRVSGRATAARIMEGGTGGGGVAGRRCGRSELMRTRSIRAGIVPRAVLTWHEEETRFAFQNGETAFMRNWPYAYGADGGQRRSRRSREASPSRRCRPPPAAAPRLRWAARSSRSTPKASIPRRPGRSSSTSPARSRCSSAPQAVGQFPTRSGAVRRPAPGAGASIPPARRAARSSSAPFPAR